MWSGISRSIYFLIERNDIMADTISIDVVDRTIPAGNNRIIPVINQPNPCSGYEANANEVRQLIQLSNYKITVAGTNKPITGNNYYEHFPEEQPGGGKYSITVLWDYTTDNNGTIPYDPFTATLHDNINNYDAIQMELVSIRDDLSTSDWNSSRFSEIISVDALNNSIKNNYFNYTSFDDRSSRWHIKDTTVQKTTTNLSKTNGLVRVYGIKF